MIIKRNKKSHKGENGKVLAVGGSKEYAGAIALAGIAALRAGCDLVTVCAPEKVAWAVNSLYPDLITVKFRGDYLNERHADKIIKLSKDSDVVLMGNGMALKSAKLARKLVKNIDNPFVLDADAIKAVKIQDVKNSILTPHEKELEILLENSGYANINRLKSRKMKAKHLQKIVGTNVILLKGPTDYVISAKKIRVNRTGNPGMTKGGTGDVLAGICAGFLAQTKKPFYSAQKSSEINGRIANILLQKKKGYYYLASDMVEELEKMKVI